MSIQPTVCIKKENPKNIKPIVCIKKENPKNHWGSPASYFFPSIDHPLCLCAWFFILFHLTDEFLSINSSANVFVFGDFKGCISYFLSNFIFHQIIAFQKPWKMLFISSKKLFLFSRYSNFCLFIFPAFFLCQPLL